MFMFTAGILTISDKGSKGQRADASGQVIKDILSRLDCRVAEYDIVPDEQDAIAGKLAAWADAANTMNTINVVTVRRHPSTV